MIRWSAAASWLRQPTTIAGLAALSGDAFAIALGAATWRLEAPLALGALVAMLLPDNTAAATAAASALRDGLAAAATHDPARIAAACEETGAAIAAAAGRARPA